MSDNKHFKKIFHLICYIKGCINNTFRIHECSEKGKKSKRENLVSHLEMTEEKNKLLSR